MSLSHVSLFCFVSLFLLYFEWLSIFLLAFCHMCLQGMQSSFASWEHVAKTINFFYLACSISFLVDFLSNVTWSIGHFQYLSFFCILHVLSFSLWILCHMCIFLMCLCHVFVSLSFEFCMFSLFPC